MAGIFEIYYDVSEIAARLSHKKKWALRCIQAGDFGPIENVRQIGKRVLVPQSGIDFFLNTHAYKRDAFTLDQNRREMQRRLEGLPIRGPFGDGVPARSEGELRRKVLRTVTAAKEAA